MNSAALVAVHIFLLTLFVAGPPHCLGQAEAEANNIVPLKGCEGVNFEREGYRVRSSRIEDPFDFLPWVRTRQRRTATKIASLVDGKPFLYITARDQAREIIEQENFLPDTTDLRVKIRLELLSVENCSDSSLDLVYRVYSTQIMPVLSSLPESRTTERRFPQEAAGMTRVSVPSRSPIHLSPLAGYDSTNKLSGGARLEIIPKRLRKLPFSSLLLQARGSSEMGAVSAAFTGSKDSQGWLAHSEWLLNYDYYSLPTGEGNIKGSDFSAQFTGITKPLAQGNLTLRFGGLLKGGNRQSDIRNLRLAENTVPSSAFGALRFYAGLASRLRHNILSASYGLELGSVGPAARVDWRKHIIDIRHELWYPLGNHRILDLESRFTMGVIQVPGKIPLPERFFGGNNEQFFLAGDSWKIRANPVIRAIPGSRLYCTNAGDGGEKFFSYNLTAAYSLWRKPLMPAEIVKDADFNTELQNAIDVVTGNRQNYHVTKDPRYGELIAQLLPTAQTALDDLKQAVQDTQQARPGQFEAQFDDCLKAINTAVRRTRSAAQARDVGQQYGSVRALLSPSIDVDENRLAKVMTCVTDLSAALGEYPLIATARASLESIQDNMETKFGQIDQTQAESKAKAEMAYTRRTLTTLFNEVNLYSVSPVIVFDVARLGSGRGGFGGLRYGPGAGLRFEFASAAHFTAGYAWNIKPRAGEGNGTLFFSLGVRDLFH
ncbi:MAG: hypothetical protein M3410_12275 [Acidobacteriota bacterium]|nr:hypothetical protein [Acidobacteriota bacterium]